MPDPRPVLLLIETSSGFARRLIQGITAYAHEHGPWILALREGTTESLSAALDAHDRIEGIIARLESPALLAQVQGTGLPFVNVSGTYFADDVPWVDVNNTSVCRLIVQEFVRNGYESFAFCGLAAREWSTWREDLFTAMVRERGDVCARTAIGGEITSITAAERDRLARWLAALPKPVAIMAANDACGYELLKACHAGGVSVPEEVAVIGVDNDELVCELSYPSLSSVLPNTETIGHRAAEVLDRLMAGKPQKPAVVKVEPLGIETRRSTGAVAHSGYFLRRALRYIQSHACAGINVHDVLKAVPVSRTALEAGLRAMIGRSPHAEISRIRLEAAKDLLVTTELSLTEIALHCGYRNVDYFSAAFKRDVGLPPSAFRKRAT